MTWLALLMLPAQAGDLDAAVQQALTPRHGTSCADLAGLGDSTEVRDALVRVADGVDRPPWVPMRAAGCVVELYAADPVAVDVAERWMDSVERPGLGLVVAGELDRFEAPVAIRLAERAAARGATDERFGRLVAPKLERSAHEEVAALGEKMTGER